MRRLGGYDGCSVNKAYEIQVLDKTSTRFGGFEVSDFNHGWRVLELPLG